MRGRPATWELCALPGLCRVFPTWQDMGGQVIPRSGGRGSALLSSPSNTEWHRRTNRDYSSRCSKHCSGKNSSHRPPVHQLSIPPSYSSMAMDLMNVSLQRTNGGGCVSLQSTNKPGSLPGADSSSAPSLLACASTPVQQWKSTNNIKRFFVQPLCSV